MAKALIFARTITDNICSTGILVKKKITGFVPHLIFKSNTDSILETQDSEETILDFQFFLDLNVFSSSVGIKVYHQPVRFLVILFRFYCS